MNSNQKCVGIIPRNYIIILLNHHHWYGKEAVFDENAKSSVNQEVIARA